MSNNKYQCWRALLYQVAALSLREIMLWPPSWNYRMVSNQKSDSVNLYIFLEEQSSLVSSWSDLKRQGFRLFWRNSPSKNNKISSDMRSVPSWSKNIELLQCWCQSIFMKLCKYKHFSFLFSSVHVVQKWLVSKWNNLEELCNQAIDS